MNTLFSTAAADIWVAHQRTCFRERHLRLINPARSILFMTHQALHQTLTLPLQTQRKPTWIYAASLASTRVYVQTKYGDIVLCQTLLEAVPDLETNKTIFYAIEKQNYCYCPLTHRQRKWTLPSALIAILIHTENRFWCSSRLCKANYE